MKLMRTALAVALMAIAVCPLYAATPQDTKKQDAKKVQGEGCVEAGVEARCLVLKDIKSGKIYNILVKEPRPKAGDGIEFTGTLYDGVTMCMQGTPVQVDSWEHKDTLKCGGGEKQGK